jgi:hypothetical protein
LFEKVLRKALIASTDPFKASFGDPFEESASLGETGAGLAAAAVVACAVCACVFCASRPAFCNDGAELPTEFTFMMHSPCQRQSGKQSPVFRPVQAIVYMT